MLLFTISVSFVSVFLVGNAVNITNFKVPSWHIIQDEDNPQPLILDCEYDYQPGEQGIVLKWLLNGTEIYQWIPDSTPPYSRVSKFNLMHCEAF